VSQGTYAGLQSQYFSVAAVARKYFYRHQEEEMTCMDILALAATIKPHLETVR